MCSGCSPLLSSRCRSCALVPCRCVHREGSWQDHSLRWLPGAGPGMSQVFAGKGGGWGWHHHPHGTLWPRQGAAVQAQSSWQGGSLAVGWEGSPVPSSAAVHINHCAGVLGLGERRLCRMRCLGRGGSLAATSCAGGMGSWHRGRAGSATEKATTRDTRWCCWPPGGHSGL